MGGPPCVKILLCGPPISDAANRVVNAINRYLEDPKNFPLDEAKLQPVIDKLEAAEELMAEAEEALVHSAGGY